MTKNLAQDFNEWMANMGNIHYSDDNKMARAFEIIQDHEKI
jgi:hypothetical protein|tara:strand:- start:68 stop:190 length:123 start_codon:yes stop_codon:yes gene_type:complete